MKKLVYSITVLLILSFAVTSCKKQDSTYKDFIVTGGLTYTAKITAPLVYAGRNRLKLSWLRGADPDVTKARVFWNNYADSIEVSIPPTGDTISVIIDNLQERTYSFVVRTYDNKGNSSIPVELIGKSFGDKYQEAVVQLNRPINYVLLDAQNKINIMWGAANQASGAYATEVTYTDTLETEQVRRVMTTEDSTSLYIKPGTFLSYKTLYLPDALAIDTFYTSSVQNTQFLLDKSSWSVLAFSSQHAGAANLATNVIDGNPATRWHTNATTSKYPHFVTLDMKVKRTITAFELFRATNDDRACDRFQLLVSQDNVTWTDLGTYDFNRFTNDGQVYTIKSNPIARYLKFVGLSGPMNYMVTGEINVYGLPL